MTVPQAFGRANRFRLIKKIHFHVEITYEVFIIKNVENLSFKIENTKNRTFFQ